MDFSRRSLWGRVKQKGVAGAIFSGHLRRSEGFVIVPGVLQCDENRYEHTLPWVFVFTQAGDSGLDVLAAIHGIGDGAVFCARQIS